MDMSDINGRQVEASIRADLFAQLSEFFKEPSPGFVADASSGRLARYVGESLVSLGLDPSPAAQLLLGVGGATLQAEYRRLFLGPLPPYVVPVESIYKRWTNAHDCQLPFAASKGHLMGDAALDMLRCYRDRGIDVPAEFASMPDHVALQLEFLSYLTAHEAHEAGSEFLRVHLDWLDDLVRDIEQAGSSSFYAMCACVTRDILRKMRQDDGQR